jgi:hypothetical protein
VAAIRPLPVAALEPADVALALARTVLAPTALLNPTGAIEAVADIELASVAEGMADTNMRLPRRGIGNDLPNLAIRSSRPG